MNKFDKKEHKKTLSIREVQMLIMESCRVVNSIELYDKRKFLEVAHDLMLHKALIVLLINQENPTKVGHYVCLTIKDGVLYFFDSYGVGLQLPFDTLDVFFTFLEYVCGTYNLEMKENKIKYQEIGDDGNRSCGRWCIIRSMHRFLDDKEFDRQIKGKLMIDNETEKVLAFTSLIDFAEMANEYAKSHRRISL